MNLKKFFNPDVSKTADFDYDLNQLILNQLTIYAVEDDEERFDKLLKKAQNLLSPYSIVDTYELLTDSRDGNITSANIERGENPDYSTYLHFAAYSLTDKYAVKIAKVAINHSKEDYNRYIPIHKDNYLIQACIDNKKTKLFDFLINNNFLTEEKVYDCLFVYKHKEMFEQGKHLFNTDLNSIFRTWERNCNNSSKKIAASRDICFAFMNHKDLISNFSRNEKEQYKQFAIPFLLFHHENLYQEKDKEEVKKLFMFFMEHLVIDIHSVFEKKEEKYILGVGEKTISELLKFTEKDISWVLEKRADYFSKTLEEKTHSQIRGVKI